jgi:hypothetical protein
MPIPGSLPDVAQHRSTALDGERRRCAPRAPWPTRCWNLEMIRGAPGTLPHRIRSRLDGPGLEAAPRNTSAAAGEITCGCRCVAKRADVFRLKSHLRRFDLTERPGRTPPPGSRSPRIRWEGGSRPPSPRPSPHTTGRTGSISGDSSQCCSFRYLAVTDVGPRVSNHCRRPSDDPACRGARPRAAGSTLRTGETSFCDPLAGKLLTPEIRGVGGGSGSPQPASARTMSRPAAPGRPVPGGDPASR